MNDNVFRFRLIILTLFSLAALMATIYRLWELHTVENEFLQAQGFKRALRTIPVTPFRGMIVDRHGHPLAISTPVKSIWVDPYTVDLKQKEWAQLAQLLEQEETAIKAAITKRKEKRFLYIKRHLPPALSNQIEMLNLKGVFFKTEYKRFYPDGEVFAHVLGLTNIDHQGIQGLEQSFDKVLAGKPGRYKVLKDRSGRKIGGFEYEILPENGENITLSLDTRIQYIAYKTLKEAVYSHRAQAGTVVVLDAQTSEILAMASQPSFNPNTKIEIMDSRFRNRAVTDTFEPGSVIKAISMVNILQSDKYTPHSKIDTTPGWVKVNNNLVKDFRNYGVIDLNTVIKKSSNVGIAKLTLSLPPEMLIDTFRKMGFGQKTDSGYPGEASGFIDEIAAKRPFSLATMAFGYGLTATPLQVAQSYAILANNGQANPVTFIKRKELPPAEQVIPSDVAQAVSKMLQSTTQKGGTATRASLTGYSTAGKTGTVRKVNHNGYSENEHIAVFAGFAPANNPKVVIVVMIDNPTQGKFYGGEVAAPAFAKIAYGIMRYLNIPQDNSQLPKPILAKH